MLIQAIVAQFPVSQNIPENLAALQSVLAQAREGDLVLLPEGGLSGYSEEPGFLDRLDEAALHNALEQLRRAAKQRAVHLWVGAYRKDQGRWYNAAWGFTPAGETHCYHKINLATAERQDVTAGRDLPVFRLEFPQGEALIGVQLCRELRYPEQWGWLARRGAQVILHLNNATGSDVEQPVWRSHLISRAAETQRFVLSANNAAARQKCPSLAVAPGGQVLGEIVSSEPAQLRIELDLAQVSNWYLNQRREDVVKMVDAHWLDEMDN